MPAAMNEGRRSGERLPDHLHGIATAKVPREIPVRIQSVGIDLAEPQVIAKPDQAVGEKKVEVHPLRLPPPNLVRQALQLP